MIINNIELNTEAKAWLRRKNGRSEIVRVVPDEENKGPGRSYSIYTAFEERPDYLGKVLFDALGYWIYDGEALTIAEQEQLAKFIMNYVPTI